MIDILLIWLMMIWLIWGRYSMGTQSDIMVIYVDIMVICWWYLVFWDMLSMFHGLQWHIILYNSYMMWYNFDVNIPWYTVSRRVWKQVSASRTCLMFYIHDLHKLYQFPMLRHFESVSALVVRFFFGGSFLRYPVRFLAGGATTLLWDEICWTGWWSS